MMPDDRFTITIPPRPTVHTNGPWRWVTVTDNLTGNSVTVGNDTPQHKNRADAIAALELLAPLRVGA